MPSRLRVHEPATAIAPRAERINETMPRSTDPPVHSQWRVSAPLRTVFIIHGVATLAAAVVLAVAPGAIPSTVNIPLDRAGFLLCYLLAATELAIALLSFGAVRLTDRAAVRLIVMVFIAFHLTTGVLELGYLTYTPASPALIANAVVRFGAAGVFAILWRVRLGR